MSNFLKVLVDKSGVYQGIMIIRDELSPHRLVPCLVSKKKEELPSPGLVTQPNLWEFATCVPERATKTAKKSSFQNSMELGFVKFPSDLSPGTWDHSFILSPSQAGGFPCGCPEPWICLQRLRVLHGGSGSPAAPLLGKLIPLAPGLLCTSQSSSAHVLCPSHPFLL